MMFGRRERRRKKVRRRVIGLIFTAFLVVIIIFVLRHIDWQSKLLIIPAFQIFGHTFPEKIIVLPGSEYVYSAENGLQRLGEEIDEDLEALEQKKDTLVDNAKTWVENTGETISNKIQSIDGEQVKDFGESVLEKAVNGYFFAGNYIIDHTNGRVPTYEELKERSDRMDRIELPESYEDVKNTVKNVLESQEDTPPISENEEGE